MVAVVFRSSWPFDTMLAKSTSVCLIVSFATLAHSATLATTVSRAPASIVLQVDASQSPSPTEKAVLPNVELLRRSDPGLCGYWNGNAGKLQRNIKDVQILIMIQPILCRATPAMYLQLRMLALKLGVAIQTTSQLALCLKLAFHMVDTVLELVLRRICSGHHGKHYFLSFPYSVVR